MIVRFVASYGCYGSGERAGFSSEEARSLVERGVAVLDGEPQFANDQYSHPAVVAIGATEPTGDAKPKRKGEK